MKIRSKKLINQIFYLYNIVSSNNMIIENVLNYNFENIIDCVSPEEQEVCKIFDELIFKLDVEIGEAEIENRDIDKRLIKCVIDKILERIDYYKYFIEIDLSQYSPILRMTIKEYIDVYQNLKPDFSIKLSSIVQDGIELFGLNDITIIDFIRQVSIELKKSNIVLFKDRFRYDNIEHSLNDWENGKSNIGWIFKYGEIKK